MTASLYQHGSWRNTGARFLRAIVLPSGHGPYTPYSERQMPGLDTHPLGLAVPLPGMAVHQILPLGDSLVGQSELPERQLEMALLGVGGIEAYRHQNEIGQVLGALAEVQDVVIPGVVGLKAEMGLQRRVVRAPAVEPGDLGQSVAWGGPVARAQLGCRRFEALRRARQRLAFAQLEARIRAARP